jgi:hypothetical protein
VYQIAGHELRPMTHRHRLGGWVQSLDEDGAMILPGRLFSGPAQNEPVAVTVGACPSLSDDGRYLVSATARGRVIAVHVPDLLGWSRSLGGPQP